MLWKSYKIQKICVYDMNYIVCVVVSPHSPYTRQHSKSSYHHPPYLLNQNVGFRHCFQHWSRLNRIM